MRRDTFCPHQPDDRKAPIFWDHAGLPNWIISVEAERSGDRAHRIGFGKDTPAPLSVSGPSRIADGAARSRRRGHSTRNHAVKFARAQRSVLRGEVEPPKRTSVVPAGGKYDAATVGRPCGMHIVAFRLFDALH